MRRERKPMPARNKKNFRPTKSGAGMTRAGVKAYRRLNPGSKLKTAVTGKVKKGSKAAKRRKSYCARSLGQLKRNSAKTRKIRTHVFVRQEEDGNVKKKKNKKGDRRFKKASKAHAGQAKILKGVINGGSKKRNRKKT